MLQPILQCRGGSLRFSTFRALIVMAILVLSGLSSQSQSKQSADAKQIAKIRAVLDAQAEAWNKGDVDAFLQGYWHSPELTFSGSTGVSRGWDNVRKRYLASYPDRKAMGTLTFSDLEFRQLGPDAFLVLGNWHLDRVDGELGGVFSLVFQQFPDGWKIIHDHTSQSKPAPAKKNSNP